MKIRRDQLPNRLPRFLLVVILTFLLLPGLVFWNAPSAGAVVRQQEEAPRQMLYQSRQTLRDNHGKTWQAIAFKRVYPDNTSSFSLRLVGFPGAVILDHSQPLTLLTSLGKTLTAADVSQQIFTDTVPPAHIAQYDLQPVISQLQPEIPLVLQLPTKEGAAIKLRIPSGIVQEWQTVAGYVV